MRFWSATGRNVERRAAHDVRFASGSSEIRSLCLAGDTFDAVALAWGWQQVRDHKPPAVARVHEGGGPQSYSPALHRRGSSCRSTSASAAPSGPRTWGPPPRLTFAALQAVDDSYWTMVPAHGSQGRGRGYAHSRTLSTGRGRLLTASPAFLDVGEELVKTRQSKRQQGPGRVQGRRRDVLLPAHRRCRALSIPTPRRGRARRPRCPALGRPTIAIAAPLSCGRSLEFTNSEEVINRRWPALGEGHDLVARAVEAEHRDIY